MTLDPRFADALARLPDYLGGHLLVSVTALALGLAVSLPLAVLSAHRPAPRGILLLSPKRARDRKLIAALTPLVNAIDVKAMREANAWASNADTTPDAVARTLLEEVTKN